jgi:predicted nucleic acid-binding protein
MIVVDTNVLVARNLEHAMSALAGEVGRLDPNWIAPPLWRYEFQNVLAKALWTRRLTLDTAAEAWRCTLSGMADNEHEPSAERVIELACIHRITGYDANFIALAMEMGVPCVTEDGELQEKFPGLALGMQAFLDQGRSSGAVREPRATYRTRRKA